MEASYFRTVKCLAYLFLALAWAMFSGYNSLPTSISAKLTTNIAPGDTIDTLAIGCAQIIQSRSITRLVKKHIAFNQAQKTVDGYRIEIFSGAGTEGKTGAGSVRTAFLEKYTTVKAYLSFNQPNYSLRIGDFKDRIEALRFLEKIKDDYPDALLVKEKVVK